MSERNMTDFWYIPYEYTMTDLNDDGEHTGEFHRAYGYPVSMKGNISVPSGRANQTFYGQDIRYTHTLVMDNPNVDIKESGLIFWKGIEYEILAVRPSINSVTIALRRQTSDNYEPYIPDESEVVTDDYSEEYQDDA